MRSVWVIWGRARGQGVPEMARGSMGGCIFWNCLSDFLAICHRVESPCTCLPVALCLYCCIDGAVATRCIAVAVAPPPLRCCCCIENNSTAILCCVPVSHLVLLTLYPLPVLRYRRMTRRSDVFQVNVILNNSSSNSVVKDTKTDVKRSPLTPTPYPNTTNNFR